VGGASKVIFKNKSMVIFDWFVTKKNTLVAWTITNEKDLGNFSPWYTYIVFIHW
jgi:hypothetical protein